MPQGQRRYQPPLPESEDLISNWGRLGELLRLTSCIRRNTSSLVSSYLAFWMRNSSSTRKSSFFVFCIFAIDASYASRRFSSFLRADCLTVSKQSRAVASHGQLLDSLSSAQEIFPATQASLRSPSQRSSPEYGQLAHSFCPNLVPQSVLLQSPGSMLRTGKTLAEHRIIFEIFTMVDHG